jgi:acetate kinase
MTVLVLNVGSSSIKYEIFVSGRPTHRGMIDGIGGHARHILDGEVRPVAAANHLEALRVLLFLFRQQKLKLKAIGHRVVHGGRIDRPVRITKAVLEELRQASELAPLHNPPQVAAIEACMKLFPVPQVAVFDTAFFHGMPERAARYAIPHELADKHGIRRYGFHGTSHQYVAEEACRLLKKDLRKLRVITCHLGNGCSMAAISKGRPIDTSMGFTPLEGLMMGTRSGDLDPAIVAFLAERERLSPYDVESLLNHRSGLLGVSGVSNDMRELLKAKGARARLAVEMFTYRIVKYLGAYAAALGGVDLIVFTAGIGENSPIIRERILSRLAHLGVSVDRRRNAENANVISDAKSKVTAMVVPTHEAAMIARETLRALR